MAEKKTISQKARNKSFLSWIYGNLTCFSQEHMQTFGYLASMLPIVDELYDTDDQKVEALSTYTTFFNTEPQIGSMVVGSIIVGTFIPILLGIALGLSKGGSVLGPLFYVVVWNLIMYFGMKFAYDQGYSLGSSAVEALVGPESEALRSSIVMIGTMVIGSVAATWINVTTSLNIAGVDIQTTLNGIFPKVLNLLFVYLCWWLMTKKKLSPTVVMLILVVVALVGVVIGVFNPGLSY